MPYVPGSTSVPPEDAAIPESGTSLTVGPSESEIDEQRLAATRDSDDVKHILSQESQSSADDIFSDDEDVMESASAEAEEGLAATLDSGHQGLQPGVAVGLGLWSNEDVGTTMPSGEQPEEGMSDEQRKAITLTPGTARPPIDFQSALSDEERIAETIEPGTARPPSPPDARLSDSDPRLVQTADSKKLSPGVAERMMNLWSGRFGSSATPRMSIKTEARSIEAEAHLNIQPRIVCEAKDSKLAQADYEILGPLGEGGMGVVREARQASMDRTVAIKMLKPSEGDPRSIREKFLSEAVVTGELEHPNIVPIYDVARDPSGALFYSMKRVRGTPWVEVIGQKTQRENIEILMKVADAVGFAHSKRVVHRDLKPENVMLGDYGEVLLMDWGLAITLRGQTSADLGGTPAYMAPEMAAGPVDRIGLASDIYLLGAILYEIITGKTPHTGKNVMQCLFAAARNEIQPTDKSGELLSIALKTMASKAENRFVSVAEFQDAIRQYESHSESVALSTKADADLQRAIERSQYETFARALFGFQEAQRLWQDNPRAQAGIEETTLAYAEAAFASSDFDLGISMLSDEKPQHVELLRRLRQSRREREARQQRLKTARRVGSALAVLIFVVITVAFFWVKAEETRALRAEADAIVQREAAEKNAQIAKTNATEAERQRLIAVKNEADAKTSAEAARKSAEEAKLSAEKEKKSAAEALAQKAEADRQREKAVEQTKIADQQRIKAEQQTKIANQQTEIANQEKTKAETARGRQEYEAYVARIGAAAARIEENAFGGAKELLDQCPAHLRDWEWGRLMHLCSQGVQRFDTGQPVDTVAYSPDGKRFVTGGWSKTARIWDVASGKELQVIATSGEYVFAAAFSPDGRYLALGGNGQPAFVGIWDADKGSLVRPLPGHRDAVLSVCFSRDGKRLLTTSYDNTARLWNVETGECLRVLRGHEWWVWSASFSPDEQRIVTASQDGSIMVWSAANGKVMVPPFLGHNGPVYTAAFSSDGKLIGSGGYDKQVLLWDPAKVKPFHLQTKPTESVREVDPAIVAVMSGHTAGVRSLRFSQDGKLLLTAGNDNTLRVWDLASGMLRKTLRGHAGQVTSCAVAPDGQQVLTGSYDHQVKIWNIAGYEESRIFQGQVVQGHNDAILSAVFSPDGRQILTASRDRTARAWDVTTGQELRAFREGHQFLASRAMFLPGAKQILTAGVDSTVRVWDMGTGTEVQTLAGTGPSAAVVLSRDGSQIITGSDDKSVKVWDTRSGKLLRKLEGHQGDVAAVAVSPDDSRFATGDALGRLRSWDAKSGNLQWEVKAHGRNVTAVLFHPEGKRVLTASVDNTVAEWDATTGREVAAARLKHPDVVTSMDISPDGRHLLTTCSDKATRLWDLTNGQQVRKFALEGLMLSAAAFTSDGKRALLTASDNTVRLWDAETGREVAAAANQRSPLIDLNRIGGQVWSAVLSPDAQQLLIVGGDEARLWDIRSNHEIMRFNPHGSVASAQYSPDGKHVVTGSWDKTGRIWNALTGRDELKLEGGHERYVNAVAYSPDGQRVVTASDDKTVRIWNVETGKVLVTLSGHEDRVRSSVFSPDGSQVLTASNDKTARIWNARTGEQIQVLKGHDQAVLCAAFSADGRRVVTASEDTTARIWDVASGREADFRLQGHSSTVTSAAFSRDGRRIVTGSQDSTAKLWDAQTGKEVLALKAHTQEVTSVAFSPDGRQVLTASRDGKAIVWLTLDWRSSTDTKVTSFHAVGYR